MDIDHLNEWIGRTEASDDVASVGPVSRLAAMLNAPEDRWELGDDLPPLWHWLYFLPDADQTDIGEDGHPKRGDFLPPISLQRRMFAGGRVRFIRPIRLGHELRRVSRIESIEHKKGRHGDLIFVKVRNEIRADDELSLVEVQNLVYIDSKGSGPYHVAGSKSLPSTTWRWSIDPTPTLLFRYSALTFNAHRIHYDRPYATTIEGYPGLVVQGPLIATLMMEMVRREESRKVVSLDYQIRLPLFDDGPVTILGTKESDAVGLEAYDHKGRLGVSGSAGLRPVGGR